MLLLSVHRYHHPPVFKWDRVVVAPLPPLVHCPGPIGKMSNSLGHSLEDKEKSGFEQDVEVQHRILETAPNDVIVSRFGFMGGLLSKLFASGVEARGVERVPEDQRETKNTWNKYVNWSQTFSGVDHGAPP